MVAGEYRAARAALPCTDVPTSDPDFVALLDDLDEVRQFWPADWRSGIGTYVRILRRHGCDFLALGSDRMAMSDLLPGEFPPYLFGVNLCVEGGSFWPLKPLSYFCPEACGCRGGDPHCPDSCPVRDPKEELCPAYQRPANWPYIHKGFEATGSCPMVQTYPGDR